jgi:hypothetical protein
MAVEDAIRNPTGCDMSFRANVFTAVGGFDVSLGRLGARRVGCEETELSIRVKRHWPLTETRFATEALVYHRVPKSRVTVRYFLSRCFSEGISKALVRLTASLTSSTARPLLAGLRSHRGAASLSMALSRESSATSFFRREFSRSRSFSLRAWSLPRPPHSFRQR